jgi:hypothetical protein
MIPKSCHLLGCAVLACCAGGCGGRAYEGQQRFPLTGKVMVDGQPMEHGLISFLPQSDGGRVCGGPITAGSYSVPEEMGATAGTYHVRINWNKPTGKKVLDFEGEPIMDETKEGLPDKYHASSELTAEVSAKKTTFDFDLQSK